MKTTYLQKNKNSRRVVNSLAILIAIAFFVFIMNFFFKRAVQMIAYPFLLFKNNVSNSIIYPIKSFLSSKTTLSNENSLLKKEIENLKIQLEQHKLLSKNSNSNSIPAYIKIPKNNLVLNVLMSPGVSPYDNLIIESTSTLKQGDYVYSDGVMIGFVDEVFLKTAKVKLISSPQSVLDVKINNIELKAQGRGLGNFLIIAPKDTAVSVGDPVIVSSSREYIGQIEYIDKNSSDAFEAIYFKIPVSIQSLQWIEIKHI